MNVQDLKENYSVIIVTLVSILLGLSLEDLVSIIREIESKDVFVWLSSIFVTLIIMNAWIAYSSAAISVKLVPIPGDAFNIFVLSAAHFSLNTYIGKPPYQFFIAIAVYCVIAVGVVNYHLYRISKEQDSKFQIQPFHSVSKLNLSSGAVFGFIGYLSFKGLISPGVEILFVALSIPFALLWITLFWKAWSSQIP